MDDCTIGYRITPSPSPEHHPNVSVIRPVIYRYVVQIKIFSGTHENENFRDFPGRDRYVTFSVQVGMYDDGADM